MENNLRLGNHSPGASALFLEFSIVMPVYNHAALAGDAVRQAAATGFPVIVVDDGSTDGVTALLEQIPGVKVLRHSKNLGKGAALRTGFAEAAKTSRFAITIDADGQHYPDDVQSLIKAIPAGARPIVVGARIGMTPRTAPWTSRFGRRFSNFWVSVCGGPKLSDSQSGFRIYPLPECLTLPVLSGRFQFEIEILIRAHWSRMRVIEAPVRVNYRPGGARISHFHPWLDFWRNSGMFTRLWIQRWCLPQAWRNF